MQGATQDKKKTGRPRTRKPRPFKRSGSVATNMDELKFMLEDYYNKPSLTGEKHSSLSIPENHVWGMDGEVVEDMVEVIKANFHRANFRFQKHSLYSGKQQFRFADLFGIGNRATCVRTSIYMSDWVLAELFVLAGFFIENDSTFGLRPNALGNWTLSNRPPRFTYTHPFLYINRTVPLYRLFIENPLTRSDMVEGYSIKETFDSEGKRIAVKGLQDNPTPAETWNTMPEDEKRRLMEMLYLMNPSNKKYMFEKEVLSVVPDGYRTLKGIRKWLDENRGKANGR